MRIISGKFKSRKIRFPKTKMTRPMMDRMKETLFNIITTDIENTKVLDLFCGSGSLGLEAISRGASHVVFVDGESEPCEIVKKNLNELLIGHDQASILQLPSTQALRYLSKRQRKFDLIFLDPPYNKGLIKKTLRQLMRFDIVNAHGKIVIHRAKQESLPSDILHFKITSEREVGQAYLTFLAYDIKA